MSFLDTHSFTNTKKGRTDLKMAVLVGFYILQRPRRVQDYATLQYYSKLPSEADPIAVPHIITP
jgi:hypothetical protein